jgi:hypothetical protein
MRLFVLPSIASKTIFLFFTAIGFVKYYIFPTL